MTALQEIPFDRLHPSPLNPRKDKNDEGIDALAASIEKDGILQNLTARPSTLHDGEFEIIAGATRWEAFGRLIEEGKRKREDPLPVRVKDPCSDLELVELAMIENLQRDDLHPLDEAEGYAKLRELGLKVAEIEQIVPHTARHVQLRLQLADNLTAETKAAFRGGKFNLASARILAATCLKPRQAAVVERIKAGDPHYNTPNQLKQSILDAAIPLEHAIFARDEYKGPVLIDESQYEDEEPIELAADIEDFWRLQNEALETRREELAKLWSDARIIRENQHWWPGGAGFDTGCKDRKKGIAVLVVHPDGEVTEHTGLVERGTATPNATANTSPKNAKGKPGPTAAELAAKSGEDTLPTKVGQVIAKHAKTRALRAAIVDKGARPAMIAVCVALMGGRKAIRLNYTNDHAQHDATESPEVEKVFAKCRGRLQNLVDKKPHNGTAGEGGRLAIPWGKDTSTELFNELTKWKPAEIEELFTALVAASVGTYTGYDYDLGDPPVAVAMAEALQADVAAAWKLDEAYLATLRKPGLVRVARDLGTLQPEGAPWQAESLGKMKTAELKKVAFKSACAGGIEVRESYLPPLFHFGSEAEVRAKIKPSKTGPAIPESAKAEPAKATAKKAAAKESAGQQRRKLAKKVAAKKPAAKRAPAKAAAKKAPAKTATKKPAARVTA